jgi:hypothetical protein
MALTRLDLSRNDSLESGWQHLLPLIQLRHLDLPHCYLTAVPAQLSALTALTSLDLLALRPCSNSWQHTLPLTQLRFLGVRNARLREQEAQALLAALPDLCVKHGIMWSWIAACEHGW